MIKKIMALFLIFMNITTLIALNESDSNKSSNEVLQQALDNGNPITIQSDKSCNEMLQNALDNGKPLIVRTDTTILNVNKNNNQNTASPATNVYNQNKSTQTTAVTVSLTTKFYNTISSINYKIYKKRTTKFLKHNKKKIFFCTLGILYFGVCGILIRDNHYVNQKNLWSKWKGDLVFVELCTISQQALAQDLLHEIQKRYINKEQPTDFVTPLISFMNTIDYEIKRITRYIKLCTWLKRLYIIHIVPTNDTKITQAERLLERLYFVKHIFLSWAAEYNVSHKRPIRRWMELSMIAD